MKYCLFVFIILFCSCDSEPDYNDYLRQMDIVLADDFNVISHNTEGAIGDFSVDFELKISDKDFDNLIEKIKQTENYREYIKGESPNSFRYIEKKYHISGFKLADKYFYRKEVNSESIYYELVVDSDKKLHFTYAED